MQGINKRKAKLLYEEFGVPVFVQAARGVGRMNKKNLFDREFDRIMFKYDDGTIDPECLVSNKVAKALNL